MLTTKKQSPAQVGDWFLYILKVCGRAQVLTHISEGAELMPLWKEQVLHQNWASWECSLVGGWRSVLDSSFRNLGSLSMQHCLRGSGWAGWCAAEEEPGYPRLTDPDTWGTYPFVAPVKGIRKCTELYQLASDAGSSCR